MHISMQLLIRPIIRMGKKCDLSDFNCGMVVGARQGGLSISESAHLLGFSRTNRLWSLQRNGAKKQKNIQ